MKKRQLFIATLLVAAATTVAVVSCKKESRDTLLNNNAQPARTFTPPQVDDMNAYLKDFKQKMQTATRGDNETLYLEEAAWYLSSVANYDFANVNVEFTDLRYDTLYYQMNVTNGQVSLTDLNAVYKRVASDIDDFYQSLNLENAHFRFIGASISNGGEVVVTLITSYTWLDHTWYFTDPFEAMVACDTLFSEDSVYVWDGLGRKELQRVINLLEGRNYIDLVAPPQRGYFVHTMDFTYEFMDNIDPYGSPFYWDSRVFAVHGDTYYVHILDVNEMCYCLDSYLSLPFEQIDSNPSYGNLRPVHWNILKKDYYEDGDKWHLYAHIVKVKIGQLVESNSGSNEY